MSKDTNFWIYAFGLFFIGMSVIALVTGWLADRRREHRWERRCENARQAMIERERIEKRT